VHQRPTTLNVFMRCSGFKSFVPREDLMVAAVVLRTTALWFPASARTLRDPLRGVAERCCLVLRRALVNKIPFSALSRYYYSLGHFALRLAEALAALALPLSEAGFPLDLVAERVAGADVGELSGILNDEDWWWLIVGMTVGLSSSTPARYVANATNMEVVFRHRRLRHYYGGDRWAARLHHWELRRLRERNSEK
jgi:hypothetical protein